MKNVLTLLLAMVFLTGCATFWDQIRDEDQDTQLLVQWGIMKAIEQSSDITADKVLEHTRTARRLVANDPEITVAGLAEQVKANISWDRVHPSDQLILNRILERIEKQLVEQVGEGMLDEDAKFTVSVFLAWVEEAALWSK